MPDFKSIQDKWQKAWADSGIFKVREDKNKKKFYCLEMFPYPSGSYLHMGHVRNYSIGDAIARFKRLKGFNVLYPMGFDSFGLPAENAAKKANIHPREYTENAIAKIVEYMKNLGLSYDWDRMIASHRPEYYKWNQYFFIKFLEKGLAYRKKASVNFCESCNTVLANEEVDNGKCWRCDSIVVNKDLDQWFLKTTAYTEELLNGIKKLDWSDKIKSIQENWIGKSDGLMINFKLDDGSDFPIFTTRPDTIYGVTFMVIALKHPKLIGMLHDPYKKNVLDFIKEVEEAEKKDDLDFLEKSGVFTGRYVINPLNNEKVPLYAGNFVLADYATGSIMAVPAHDQRDFEFAKKYNIPIKIVIQDNAKKIAFILHGTEGNSKKNWYLWLERELEKNGYEVIVPDMPDSEFPDLHKWLHDLDKYKDKIGENTLVIGHSLGCPTAIQYLQKLNKRIKRLILVAPTHKDMDWHDYKKKNPYENSNNIQRVSETHTDWNKVKSLVPNITAYFSEDDPYIPFNVKDYYVRDLNAKIITYKDKGHFNSTGLKSDKFPELLNEVLSLDEAYVDDGSLVNSESFNGLSNDVAIDKISEYVEKHALGKRIVQYKLKDWLISRQRYWGTPIPIVYCQRCGTVALKDLPLLLPDDVDFSKPGNPILTSNSFINAKCPKCDGEAKRETDTMGGFMDSSWYFLRYCSPKTDDVAFDREAVNYWMPVDQYVGGIEHAVGHLIYSRFFTKALRDFNMLDIDEPFNALFNQGIVYKDGAKMSKSHGNIVTQDEISNKYGIDTARLFMLFVSSPDKEMEWNDKGIEGTFRFINKVYKLYEDDFTSTDSNKDKFLISRKNILIKEITNTVNDFKLNTAVVLLMDFVNYLFDVRENCSKKIYKETLNDLAIILNPFTPHLSEEIYHMNGNNDFCSVAKWPSFNEELIDEKLHYLEDVFDNTRKDIISVLELVKIKPSEIKLIIAEKWKYDLYKEVKNMNSKNQSEIIKHLMNTELKKHGQEIMKIVPKLIDKMPEYVIEEHDFFAENINELEKIFKCNITILRAEDSKEAKAKQSMPGKPAIVVS